MTDAAAIAETLDKVERKSLRRISRQQSPCREAARKLEDIGATERVSGVSWAWRTTALGDAVVAFLAKGQSET